MSFADAAQRITLVSATGHPAFHAPTVEALRECMSHADFAAVKFFTCCPGEPGDGIAYIDLPACDRDAYSRFVLHDLPLHIQTEFFLIAQADGFIINPDKWEDEWLLYDYIGAPFPDDCDIRMGNGGFCLRSKRLAERAASLPDCSAQLGWEHGDDRAICGVHRAQLEAEGFRFAPPDAAARFSIGHRCAETGGLHAETVEQARGLPSFGFHLGARIYREKEGAPVPVQPAGVDLPEYRAREMLKKLEEFASSPGPLRAPKAGTYTLTHGANTTAAISYAATAAEVQKALDATASITNQP